MNRELDDSQVIGSLLRTSRELLGPQVLIKSFLDEDNGNRLIGSKSITDILTLKYKKYRWVTIIEDFVRSLHARLGNVCC